MLSIVSTVLFRTWKKSNVKVNTISGETRVYPGIVMIHADIRNSADVEALLVPDKSLIFDLLLDYDTIKALSIVLTTQIRTVKFRKEAPVCTSLKIDQPDFSVEFDQH